MATTQALAMFARYPSVGRVKTRLAGQVGSVLATQLYASLAAHVWTTALEVQAAGVAHTFLILDPAEHLQAAADWLPGGTAYLPQVTGDLGVRLAIAFRDLFRMGYTRAVIVSSDCPALNPTLLTGALAALEESEVVIGPATDGGYYLLGLRRFQRTLFEDIPWGTPRVFDTTLQRCAQATLGSLVLPVQTDLDTAEDLMAVLGSGIADTLPTHLLALMRAAVDVPQSR